MTIAMIILIIAIYSIIGIVWTVIRQHWLYQPIVYWNYLRIGPQVYLWPISLQKGVQVLLWPISIIVYTFKYGIRSYKNSRTLGE